MKAATCLLTSLIVAVAAGSASAQTPLDALDANDFRASSGGVFQLVQADVTRLPRADREVFVRARAAQIMQNGGADPATQRAAIQRDIQLGLSQAAATRQYVDLSWRTAEGFRAIIGAGVGSIADRFPVYGAMLSETGGQVASQLLEKWKDDALEANRQAVAEALRTRIAAYIAAGNQLPPGDALRGVVEDLLRPDLTNDAGEQSIVTREVLSLAMNELRHHRQEIDQLAENLRRTTDNINNEISRTQREFEARISAVERRVDERIKRFGDALVGLSEQQRITTEEVAKLRNRVDGLDNRMSRAEAEIRQHRTDIARHEGTLNQHTQDIAETRMHLQVVGGYTLEGLPLNRQIRAIERGDFDFAFESEAAKAAYLQEARKAHTVETVLEASNTVGQLADALLASGLIRNPETAKDIQTAVTIVQSAVQIGTGIYTGNPMMVLSGAMSLAGLFGGHNAESPEMRMFRQLSESINRVNANVLAVGAKVDSLRVFVAMAYEDLSNHIAANHAMAMRRFDHLDYAAAAGNRMLAVLVSEGRENCWGQQPALQPTYAAYAAAVHSYGWVEPCLSGLNALLSPRTPDGTARLRRSSFAAAGDAARQAAEFEERHWYDPAREFFCRQFAFTAAERVRQTEKTPFSSCAERFRYARLRPFLTALHAPPGQDFSDWQTIVDGMLRSSPRTQPDVIQSLDAFFDPVGIDSTVTAFLRLRELLEIADPSQSWHAPRSVEAFLRKPQEDRVARREDMLNLIRNARSLYVQPAQVQQVLISGVPFISRIYSTFYTPDAPARDRMLARDLLRDNPYVAHNFGVSMLRRVFHVGDNGVPEPCRRRTTGDCLDNYVLLFNAYMAEAEANAPKRVEARTWVARDAMIARLNTLGVAFQLQFKTVEPTRGFVRMFSPAWTHGRESELTLPLPSPDDLRNGIVYPPAVFRMAGLDALLDGARQSIILPDLLGRNDGITADHYLWLLAQENSSGQRE